MVTQAILHSADGFIPMNQTPLTPGSRSNTQISQGSSNLAT